MSEAVRIAAASRHHAKASMARMEVYIATGNVKGLAFETRFLNSLELKARSRVAILAGEPIQKGSGKLGREAALGFRQGDRQVRSKVLGKMTNSIMAGARQAATKGPWIWVANSTACAACLNEHGTKYPAAAFFSPMHASCMCVPESVPDAQAAGVRQLTDAEMATQMIGRGGRDARLGQALLDGKIKRADLFRKQGASTVQNNLTQKALKAETDALQAEGAGREFVDANYDALLNARQAGYEKHEAYDQWHGYTLGESGEINSSLRGLAYEEEFGVDVANWVKSMDAMYADDIAILGEDMNLYRVASNPEIRAAMRASDDISGLEFGDAAYSSTATDLKTVQEYGKYLEAPQDDLIYMTIKTPSEARGILVDGISEYPSQEVVLNRGASFRVISHEGNELVVELVL